MTRSLSYPTPKNSPNRAANLPLSAPSTPPRRHHNPLPLQEIPTRIDHPTRMHPSNKSNAAWPNRHNNIPLLTPPTRNPATKITAHHSNHKNHSSPNAPNTPRFRPFTFGSLANINR